MLVRQSKEAASCNGEAKPGFLGTADAIGVVGIDPGLSGGIAIISPDGVEVYPTPTIAAGNKRRLDVPGMLDLLERRPIALAVIESVHGMPKQGVASTFNFGLGYGLWLGLLAGLKIAHQVVEPTAWKRAILSGTTRDKAAAVEWASRSFPSTSLRPTPRSRVPHHGLAEALCLAEFARRLRAGGP